MTWHVLGQIVVDLAGVFLASALGGWLIAAGTDDGEGGQ